MQSIATVFKVGHGPSSSHSVGPYSAAKFMRKYYPDADERKVFLRGSLGLTGKGHGTDKAIRDVLPEIEVVFDLETPESELPHPNTMDFYGYKNGEEIHHVRIMSIGGGQLKIEGHPNDEAVEVYPQKNFAQIMESCRNRNFNIAEFVYFKEGESLKTKLYSRWYTMQTAVESGLNKDGVLPGGLKLERKAKILYNTVSHNEGSETTMARYVSAYAFAVAEENASENVVVTAPTCGSCGVIPAVLYYMKKHKGFSDEEIVDALAVAGLVGNIIRTNASVSGAECGCQAEIGSACAMAAAALAHLEGLSLEQVEYAAEVALEHFLGLTCDPVSGLVQIPCIERNAVAALRAINAVNLARFLHITRRISFDSVVETMYRTGLDMKEEYKETSNGGLAKLYETAAPNR